MVVENVSCLRRLISMKVRYGHISNSSSSSFIVIGNSGKMVNPYYFTDGVLNIDSRIGNVEFGWEQIKYTNVGDRINFAYLQALDANNSDWLDMVEGAVSIYFPRVAQINWNLTTEDWNSPYHGHIDHQSSAGEGENIEMFENKETLHRFLFDKDSFIQGDNDNH